jgi:hypothetical protein
MELSFQGEGSEELLAMTDYYFKKISHLSR